MAPKKRTIRTIPQERTPVEELDPVERGKNFLEVNCGYKLEEALRESERCLMCPDEPCVRGCPVSIDIPAFIRKIGEKNFHGAYDVITNTNLLPAVCGRVCPQENQCEGVCTVGDTLEPVAIGRLERFVGDMAIREGWSNIPYMEPSGFRVGIVGSGPAGMAAAADMAKAGCDVTVFEAFHELGGVLRYGIPEFRLPNELIDDVVMKIKQMGGKFVTNFIVGKTATLEALKRAGFWKTFIGTGAGLPYFMGIPGENYIGVYSANEFLTRVNLMKAFAFPSYDTPVVYGERVAVVGSGNVAMDCLRTALRLGAKQVICLYRRTRDESPARLEELEHAEEEQIDFRWLSSPVEIYGDAEGCVTGVRVQRMELGEPDASGRRRPVPVEGSEFEFEADLVVYAIGTNANPIIGQTSGLKLNKWGYIDADENLATSIAGVFAGGDIVTGAATVIEAMGAGRKAARSMKAWLGLRDTEESCKADAAPFEDRLFGLDPAEHDFALVRVPRAAASAPNAS